MFYYIVFEAGRSSRPKRNHKEKKRLLKKKAVKCVLISYLEMFMQEIYWSKMANMAINLGTYS